MKLHPEFSHEFDEADKLNAYLLAGNAVVTLEAPSGTNHTYLYQKPKTDSFPEDIRFVYTLHSDMSQHYIGMIEMDKFRLTRNSRFGSDTDIVKGAVYIENMRKNQQFLQSSPMRIYHQGTCGKCGRKLSGEKSVKLGLGRKCIKRLECSKLCTQ